LYYNATKDIAGQFFEMADPIKQNYHGLGYIFTLFFLSFCRTYISAKTYYTPNSLSNQALWKLCLYSDARLYKFNYLIEQFPGNLFGFLEKHMTLHNRLSNPDKNEVGQMKVIVEQFGIVLRDLVVKEAG